MKHFISNPFKTVTLVHETVLKFNHLNYGIMIESEERFSQLQYTLRQLPLQRTL